MKIYQLAVCLSCCWLLLAGWAMPDNKAPASSSAKQAPATAEDELADPYLGFIKLVVNDLDKMEKFYQDAFGFERRNLIEIRTIEERILRLPGGTFSLVLYKDTNNPDIEIGTGHGPIGLVTKDVDALHKAALVAGATEKMAPFQLGPIRLSFLVDPEGHEIELITRD